MAAWLFSLWSMANSVSLSLLSLCLSLASRDSEVPPIPSNQQLVYSFFPDRSCPTGEQSLSIRITPTLWDYWCELLSLLFLEAFIYKPFCRLSLHSLDGGLCSTNVSNSFVILGPRIEPGASYTPVKCSTHWVNYFKELIDRQKIVLANFFKSSCPKSG